MVDLPVATLLWLTYFRKAVCFGVLLKLLSLKGFYGGDAPIKDKEKGTQRQKNVY